MPRIAKINKPDQMSIAKCKFAFIHQESAENIIVLKSKQILAKKMSEKTKQRSPFRSPAHWLDYPNRTKNITNFLSKNNAKIMLSFFSYPRSYPKSDR